MECKKCKLAKATLCKNFVHLVQDMQRLGILDQSGVEQINAVFEAQKRVV